MREKLWVRLVLVMLLLSVMMPTIGLTLTPPPTEWSQTYGGTSSDGASSVVQTFDGGYALTGETESFGAGLRDSWLVKTDAAGNMLWNKTFGGASGDSTFSVVQTSDGGYAIAGYTLSSGAGSGDFWLVKTDSAGNILWSRTYGGTNWDSAVSMVQTSDGGYALAGETRSFGAGDWDFWLVKTDSAGNAQWNRTYGGADLDEAYSVVQTSDGGFAIAGYTASFGAGLYDGWLVKTDSAGNAQWNRTYGGTNVDFAGSVVQTSDGGFAIAGYTASFGAGGLDSWLVKTDSAGNLQWNQTYGGTNVEFALSVVQTFDGGYALAGATDYYGVGFSDFWLVKTDWLGNMLWNKTFGGASGDTALSVVQTFDGGYALAGYTESFGAGASDFWLVKIAPEAYPISAAIDIDPDTLNLKSTGQWMTAYIELPERYNVADIVLEAVNLEGIQAITDPTYGFVTDPDSYLTDHDGDGILERIVKFDRAIVRETLTGMIDYEEGTKFYDLTLTVTGQLIDGTQFEGTDIIVVIKK